MQLNVLFLFISSTLMTIQGSGKYLKLRCIVSFFELEALLRRCSSKYKFLKISQISQEDACAGVSFNKVLGLNTCNFIKKRLQCGCLQLY